MSHSPLANSAHTPSAPRQRAPVVPVVVAFAAGICLDAWGTVSLALWWGSLAAAWVGWSILYRRCRPSAVWWLFLACVASGGLRHHWTAAVTTADNIALFAHTESEPAELLGTVITQPVVIPRQEDTFPSTIPQYDRTLCEIRCRSLISGTDTVKVSGTVRLQVTGHLPHVGVGDEVAVEGLLSRPVGRRNPGDFDFAEYLHRQGVDATLRTDYPDAVQVVRPAGIFWKPLRFAAQIRRECSDVLEAELSPRNAPVAAALLLGDRRDVPDDLRTAFAESGTMHFLALSGLHVGILAALLWGLCRVFRFSTGLTTAVILGCLIGYAFINEARPPVIRATIMAAVLLLGQPWHRKAQLGNSLAIAALLLLLWNPAQIFEIGPQLSFLAVAAIGAFLRLMSEQAAVRHEMAENQPQDLPSESALWIRRWIGVPLRWVWETFLLTAAIWLVVAPLIAARFHVVSPVGLAANVLLMPVVVVMLWCGYVLLFCGMLLPPLAPLFGYLFDGGLSLFLTIVDAAGRIGIGHHYVPGPANWWLAGFYVLLAAAVFACPRGRRRSWAGRVLLCWCVLGLAVAVLSPAGARLRCTFLSVGHGSAILVELPGGRTLLYDAGQLHDAERTERIVESAAWELGISRLDAVVLSHADVDHFNALPGIMDKLPVGRVYVSPSMLDTRQWAVDALCDAIVDRGVPLVPVGTDDRLLLDDEVEVRVLAPPGHLRGGADNANSLVLEITYRDRVILLTGDLEGVGLVDLLALPPRKVDVLSAPHHGSLDANTRDLAAWCNPRWVVVSGGRQKSEDKLREIYGPQGTVLSTWTSGAVTFTIDAEGQMQVGEFVQNAAEKPAP